MITAYLLLQQAAAAFGIPVVADGIPGPQTEHCARVLWPDAAVEYERFMEGSDAT